MKKTAAPYFLQHLGFNNMDQSYVYWTVHHLDTSGSQKVCSVPRGLELEDGYTKFNTKTEHLKLKTDNALPYTHARTRTHTHKR